MKAAHLEWASVATLHLLPQASARPLLHMLPSLQSRTSPSASLSALADFILASYFPESKWNSRGELPFRAWPPQLPPSLHQAHAPFPLGHRLLAKDSRPPIPPTAQRPCPINAPSLLHHHFSFSSASFPFLYNMLKKKPTATLVFPLSFHVTAAPVSVPPQQTPEKPACL